MLGERCMRAEESRGSFVQRKHRTGPMMTQSANGPESPQQRKDSTHDERTATQPPSPRLALRCSSLAHLPLSRPHPTSEERLQQTCSWGFTELRSYPGDEPVMRPHSNEGSEPVSSVSYRLLAGPIRCLYSSRSLSRWTSTTVAPGRGGALAPQRGTHTPSTWAPMGGAATARTAMCRGWWTPRWRSWRTWTRTTGTATAWAHTPRTRTNEHTYTHLLDAVVVLALLGAVGV